MKISRMMQNIQCSVSDETQLYPLVGINIGSTFVDAGRCSWTRFSSGRYYIQLWASATCDEIGREFREGTAPLRVSYLVGNQLNTAELELLEFDEMVMVPGVPGMCLMSGFFNIKPGSQQLQN